MVGTRRHDRGSFLSDPFTERWSRAGQNQLCGYHSVGCGCSAEGGCDHRNQNEFRKIWLDLGERTHANLNHNRCLSYPDIDQQQRIAIISPPEPISGGFFYS